MRMNRLLQALLIVSTLLACWLGMQDVHELGHILAAWTVGATVEQVVLHPLTISRTDVASNPSPLIVVWGGPLFGITLPALAWLAAERLTLPGAFLVRFFAGFCLIANGAYIGAGSFQGIGDAGQMLRQGSPLWLLMLFGVVTVPAGLWLWNGQGKHFGLGPTRSAVDRRLAVAMLGVCLALIVFGVLVDGQ